MARQAYYEKAAQDKTAVGKEAFGSLVELDLPDNPGRYLKVQVGIDDHGRTLARVVNNTPRPVTDIVVVAEFQDQSGRPYNRQVRLISSLPPGKSATVDLGLDNLDKKVRRTLRTGVIQTGLAE